jgi:hypothetical protein
MTGQPPFEQPQPPYQPPYQQTQYPQYSPPQPGSAAQGGPPRPQPGWAEPMDAAQAAAAQQHNAPVLVTIGDIVCTRNEVITPSGRAPIGGVVWSFTDLSRTTRTIPTWAIVCAVVFFFFCLLGLLFLLAKEDRTEGSAQIVVQGHGFLHQTQLPVYSVPQVQDLAARVSYARSLSASAASGF